MGGQPLDLGFLESKPRIRTTRAKALVAFGDMADFGAWTRRGSNSPEEFRSFMVRLYKEFIKFRNGNGYFVKLMGDGFMAVREMKGLNAGRETRDFIAHSLELETAVSFITRKAFPKPGAFRMRIVAGYVWKVIATRPARLEPSIQTDYLGYPVNLAARLLEVEREKPMLCHGSVKKIMSVSRSREEVRLRQLRTKNRCPRGIDPEDIRSLWVASFSN